jgi:hypothetical protein
MSAVKALALSALVLSAAQYPALAGPISSNNLAWTAWTPSGVIQTPAAVTSSSLFGVGSSSNVSTTAPASTQGQAASSALPSAPSFGVPGYGVPSFGTAAVATPAPTAPGTYDAFINLGTGPYPDASNLTGGGPLPWYDSQAVLTLFGGQITAQDRANFTAAVLQRVEQTFSQSGVSVTLTADPNAPAAHTLSVVSNTLSSEGAVLGLTNVGGNGFDFIDQAAKASQSVDQLEWIVAHNISHELMLAFGVPENYDHSGNYIDARDANLSMMLNPSATFSTGASQALLSQNFLDSNSTPRTTGAQVVEAQAVPEPATLAAWGAVLGGLVVARSRRNRAEA